MTRVALYARYSSDNQSAASIEDQLRLCDEMAVREGWPVVQTYRDAAISGASMILRPGIQAVLEDARNGAFDVLLAEALDRISRDQADVATLFKHLRFSGVRIITLAEGEISELHADDARPTDWRALAPQSAGLFIASGHGEAQHVSTLSADAVWKRVAEKTGGVTVASVMEADIVRLGELGLTRAKSRSIVAIAKAIDAGSFDLQCLRHMTDFEASACLKSLPGVGTWTADVYLMTCEGRQDIFPAGDIMLRPSRRSCPDQSRRPS